MTKEFIAVLEDMVKEYELLAKYKRLKEKMSHTLPQCGSDNSKERYRYMQWISDNNAIKEAADE